MRAGGGWLGLVLATGIVASASHAELSVRDAWVAEAPPGARSLAAYGVLENGGTDARTLVAVSSPSCERAELHRTRLEEGVARMVPVERLALPAGGAVRFEPGGLHVMLIGPTRELRAGDVVPLVFRFANGERLEAATPVRRRSQQAGPGSHDHSPASGHHAH